MDDFYTLTHQKSYLAEVLLKLNEYRKSSQLCDFVVVAGGKEFPAHKCVLYGFAEGFKEPIINRLEVKSETPGIMEDILNFIYTGNITITKDNIDELLMRATDLKLPYIEAIVDKFNTRFGDDIYTSQYGYKNDHCSEILKYCNEDRKVEKNICDYFISCANDSVVVPVHQSIIFSVLDQSLVSDIFKNMSEDNLKPIFELIYTGLGSFNMENIFSILSFMNACSISVAIDCCLNFLYDRINAEFFLHMFNYVRNHHYTAIYQTMKYIFYCNAEAVVQQLQFLNLTLEDITFLLSEEGRRPHQRTNKISGKRNFAKLEMDLLSGVVLWVKHDGVNRKEFLPNLIKHVRVDKLTKESLEKAIFNETLIWNCKKTLNVLCHALLPFVPLKAPHQLLLIYHDHYCYTAVNIYDVERKTMQMLPKQCNVERVVRDGTTAVSIGKKIYLIAGGRQTGSTLVNTLLLINGDEKWDSGPPLLQRRWSPCSGVINGCIFVAGGSNTPTDTIQSNDYLNSCEKYNPSDDTGWSFVEGMIEKRACHGSVVLNDVLYAIGGCNSKALNSVECYYPAVDEWRSLASMNSARSGVAVVLHNNKILAIGGKNERDGFLSSVEKYCPCSNSWTDLASLNEARHGHVACSVNGKVYVLGGETNSGPVSSIEAYDCDSNKWETIDQLVEECIFGSCLPI